MSMEKNGYQLVGRKGEDLDTGNRYTKNYNNNKKTTLTFNYMYYI